jgi:thymidylate synthase (FAD)
VDLTAIHAYLERVGGVGWADRAQDQALSDGEFLSEFAGRLCYRSWEPGLNPNVRRIRKESRAYFENLLSSRHGSVFEHAQYSFVFHHVSRVFTHELVRHRAGVAVSQESLRYVRLASLTFRIPPAAEPLRHEIIEMVERLEDFQVAAAERLRLDDEGVPFEARKEATSALRRLAPMGLATEILWSANIRTLRHVIEMRTAPGAEEEMRLVFGLVAESMLQECPMLFADFTRDDTGTWRPEHSKI